MASNDISILTDELIPVLEGSLNELTSLKNLLESSAIEQRTAEVCVLFYQRLQDNYLTNKSSFENAILSMEKRLIEAGLIQEQEPEQKPEPTEIEKQIILDNQKQINKVEEIKQDLIKKEQELSSVKEIDIKPVETVIEEEDESKPVEKKLSVLDRLKMKHGED
jgi:hypothetical protein